MKITVEPIAFVHNEREGMTDDHWDEVVSEIKLRDTLPIESLDHIENFSHLEIVYYFHLSNKEITGSEHPRENPDWPKAGIFAQRKKDRPNHIGVTIVKLLRKQDRALTVSRLDAIDGTPVLDIKPVFAEFLPKDSIRQPEWTKELMRNYW